MASQLRTKRGMVVTAVEETACCTHQRLKSLSLQRVEDLFGGFGFFQALKFFAGLEADGFAWGDADFLAGAGIAADAGLAGLDAEDAEAAEFDALAATERHFERLENRLDGLFGLGAADIRGGDNRIHDVQLDHTSLRLNRGPMLEGAPQVVKD